MKTYTIRSRGGNSYTITDDNTQETKNYCFDAFTVISDEDYEKLESSGVDFDDHFIAPMHSDMDTMWEEVAKYIANYSGFDVDEYIQENTK